MGLRHYRADPFHFQSVPRATLLPGYGDDGKSFLDADNMHSGGLSVRGGVIRARTGKHIAGGLLATC